MKRLAQMALALGIAMMCVYPSEVSGQNRTSRSESSSRSTSQQRSSSSSSATRSSSSAGSSSSSRSRSTSSQPQQKNSSVKSSAAPSSSSASVKSSQQQGQMQQRSRSASSSSQKSSSSIKGSAASSVKNSSSQQQSSSSRSRSAVSSSKGAGQPIQAAPAADKKPQQQLGSPSGQKQPAGGRGSYQIQQSAQQRRPASAVKPQGPASQPPKPSGASYAPKPGHQTPPQGGHRPDIRDPHPPKGPSHINWQRPMLQPHHKPAPAYHYGPHHFGFRVEIMPPKAVRYDFGHMGYYKPFPYYVLDGVYYRPFPGGGYVVCRPPVGVRIASSMFHAALQTAVINSYYDALYRAQRAALVSAYYATANTSYTPRTYNEISVSMSDTSTSYYYQDGVFYIYDRGEYQVIEPPVGALVKELPDDYEELVLKGETYYLVEDTLYKVTVIDGTAYFEVTCNL